MQHTRSMAATLAMAMLMITLLAAGQTAVAAGNPPDAGAAAREPARRSGDDLTGPWTYAPDRQVIAPRDPYGFRRKGSLLAEAVHKPVIQCEDALYRRGMALTGQGERPAPAPRQPAGTPQAAVAAASETDAGSVEWAKRIFVALLGGIAVTVVVAVWLRSRHGAHPAGAPSTVHPSAMRRVPARTKPATASQGPETPGAKAQAPKTAGGLRSPSKSGPKFL